MINPQDIHAMAEVIRQHVRSQDWQLFRMFEARTEFTPSYYIAEGRINMSGTGVYILCENGEMVDVHGQPSSDESVVHFYTHRLVYPFGANAELMFNYQREQLGF